MYKMPYFARRGMIRLLILNVLREGPMHGYEIIKKIESRFMGLYTPSPGTIYPNLRCLEVEGFVEFYMEDGRKVYRITDKGLKLLEEKRSALNSFFESKARSLPPEKAKLVQVGKNIFHDVFLSLHTLSPQKASEIANILTSTRKKIRKVIEG